MANLTAAGEEYLLDYLGNSTTGYNRIGIYGSVGGAADALIGAVQTITWTHPTGQLGMNEDPVFTIAANTVVKGVCLFNATEGITFGTELARYEFEAPYSYTTAGTFTVTGLTYNFDRVDL